MRKWYPIFALLLVAALFACSQQTTAPEPVTQSTLEPGEIPAEVQAKLDEYIIADEDALITLSSTDPRLSDHNSDYDVYAVTYLWGSFFPGGTSAINWNGRTVSNAESAMRVLSTIDFEDDEDVIIDENLPAVIGWRSSTLHDLDGISFLLFVKRGVVYVAAPTLAFETTPVSFAIPIEALAHHVSFHPAGQSAGVAVFAKKIRNAPCPHGHLGGKWVFDVNDRTQGSFEGRWLSRDHNTVGLLSGRFWTTADGHRHMSGSVSGVETDEVILELEGIWKLTPHLSTAVCLSCDNIGYFVGRWKYVDGSGGGKYAGHFGEPNLSSDTPELPFRGMWKQHCDHHAGDTDWNSDGT